MLAGCDLFLKYHKRTLDKAFAFDRAMLESLVSEGSAPARVGPAPRP